MSRCDYGICLVIQYSMMMMMMMMMMMVMRGAAAGRYQAVIEPPHGFVYFGDLGGHQV